MECVIRDALCHFYVGLPEIVYLLVVDTLERSPAFIELLESVVAKHPDILDDPTMTCAIEFTTVDQLFRHIKKSLYGKGTLPCGMVNAVIATLNRHRVFMIDYEETMRYELGDGNYEAQSSSDSSYVLSDTPSDVSIDYPSDQSTEDTLSL